MTALTPIERVAAVLSTASYQRISSPVKIGALDFDVPAIFLGKGRSTDIVLVFDTAFQNIGKIQQTAVSIARSLDVAKSRRSLTTIITGTRPTSPNLEAIARVSRILLALNTFDEEILNDSLSVLLPLKLPEIREVAPDVSDIAEKIPDFEGLTYELVALSVGGENEVRQGLITRIEEHFSGLDLAGGENA